MMLGSAGLDPEGSGSCGEVPGQALTHGPPSELWAFYLHSLTEAPWPFPHWQPEALVTAALWPRPPQGSL